MLEANPFYQKTHKDLPEIDYADEHAIQRAINKINKEIAELRDLVKQLHRKRRMLSAPKAIPEDKYPPESIKRIMNLFPEIYSNREIEIIYWIGQFKTEKEIANALFVCEKTVKFHKTNIYRKVNVKNEKEIQAKMYEAKGN